MQNKKYSKKHFRKTMFRSVYPWATIKSENQAAISCIDTTLHTGSIPDKVINATILIFTDQSSGPIIKSTMGAIKFNQELQNHWQKSINFKHKKNTNEIQLFIDGNLVNSWDLNSIKKDNKDWIRKVAKAIGALDSSNNNLEKTENTKRNKSIKKPIDEEGQKSKKSDKVVFKATDSNKN